MQQFCYRNPKEENLPCVYRIQQHTNEITLLQLEFVITLGNWTKSQLENPGNFSAGNFPVIIVTEYTCEGRTLLRFLERFRTCSPACVPTSFVFAPTKMFSHSTNHHEEEGKVVFVVCCTKTVTDGRTDGAFRRIIAFLSWIGALRCKKPVGALGANRREGNGFRRL